MYGQQSQISIAKAKNTDETDAVEMTSNVSGAVIYKDWLKKLAKDKTKTTLVVKATSACNNRERVIERI